MDNLSLSSVLRAITALDPSKGDIAYAQTYADAALNMGGGKELKVQLLYVLSNLSAWRGEEARESKTFLKKLSKSI